MTNPRKAKGDKAELEVQGLLRELLGVNARRMLGAGRRDDVGDMAGVPDTTIQIVNRKDVSRAIREKVPKCVEQQNRAETTHGATFVRLPGGRYVVVQTPEQWAALWREAAPA